MVALGKPIGNRGMGLVVISVGKFSPTPDLWEVELTAPSALMPMIGSHC